MVALQQRLDAQEVVMQEVRAELQQRRASKNQEATLQEVSLILLAAPPVAAAPRRTDLYESLWRISMPHFEAYHDPLATDKWLAWK